MARSARLRLSDLRALFRLAGECRDLGDDPHAWRGHYLAGLCRLIDADLALGGELAGFWAGRPRDLGAAEWGWENGFDRRGWVRALDLLRTDPTYSPVMAAYIRRGGGGGGALARSDLVDDRAWRRSVERDQVCRTIGVDHLLYCFRPVPGGGDEAAGAILTRAAGRADFTAREKEAVREAHAVLGPLVGGPLARFADPSPAALPPRVRQVLRCLLDGDSDKQVAARLGIGPYTVNQYVKHVFAHFGVTTRAELLARWVRRRWANGFAWADDRG
jgi:DNA-binding CsgD family transcriptional regulator